MRSESKCEVTISQIEPQSVRIGIENRMVICEQQMYFCMSCIWSVKSQSGSALEFLTQYGHVSSKVSALELNRRMVICEQQMYCCMPCMGSVKSQWERIGIKRQGGHVRAASVFLHVLRTACQIEEGAHWH